MFVVDNKLALKLPIAAHVASEDHTTVVHEAGPAMEHDSNPHL